MAIGVSRNLPTLPMIYYWSAERTDPLSVVHYNIPLLMLSGLDTLWSKCMKGARIDFWLL